MIDERMMLDMIDEFIEYRDLKKEIDAKMDELKKKMLGELNDAGVDAYEVGGHKIKDVVAVRSDFDKKRFIEDFGEDAYEEYVKHTSYHTFKVA